MVAKLRICASPASMRAVSSAIDGDASITTTTSDGKSGKVRTRSTRSEISQFSGG